jgi:hypothetical protein
MGRIIKQIELDRANEQLDLEGLRRREFAE